MGKIHVVLFETNEKANIRFSSCFNLLEHLQQRRDISTLRCNFLHRRIYFAAHDPPKTPAG
jgi:hypothetical protein